MSNKDKQWEVTKETGRFDISTHINQSGLLCTANTQIVLPERIQKVHCK